MFIVLNIYAFDILLFPIHFFCLRYYSACDTFDCFYYYCIHVLSNIFLLFFNIFVDDKRANKTYNSI